MGGLIVKNIYDILKKKKSLFKIINLNFCNKFVTNYL